MRTSSYLSELIIIFLVTTTVETFLVLEKSPVYGKAREEYLDAKKKALS